MASAHFPHRPGTLCCLEGGGPYSWSRLPSGGEAWGWSGAGEGTVSHSECSRYVVSPWNEAACSVHNCRL